MTAMFYHPLYGHLFILAGFFLYVYERPEMKSIETTRCSVTYAHRWFNCSSSYYDMTRFNGKRPVFTTKEEYFSEARRHHSGTFTPGQCNFFPDMPLTVGKISFTEKRFTDDPNATSAKLRLSLVNLLALAFIACALLLVCFCLIFGTLRKGKAKLVGRHGCLPGIKKRREMLVKKKSGKGVMIKKREKMENAPRGIVESRMTTQTTSSMVSESSSESNKIGKHNKKTRKSRLKNRLKSSQPPPFGAPKKCPSNGMSPSTATSGSSQQGKAKPRGKHERVSPKTGTGLANRSR